MLLRINTLFVFLLLNVASKAQDVNITGTLSDLQTGEPVPYAGMGIPGTTYGTVSSPEGRFELVLPSVHAADTMRINALGYRTA
ncbi:MAG: carboxypeptidase-like regulatory domain-containing protein, partial [Saprospiraceae bacterium]|nr:carboxypeptidase-like regulatory domain-containing protein [Saprospiraceae bacterium]